MALTSTGCDFSSGWVAGMAGLIVGHPIDTLKVRQQVLGRPMLESIGNVYRVGGVLTFFRGMGVPLLTTGAMNSIYFTFYGSSLDFMSEWRYNRKWKDKENETHSPRAFSGDRRSLHVESYMDYFIAGCVGGAAQLVVGCPVDLVKVQLQSHIQKSVIKGPVDCVIRILNTKGIAGLYKGIAIQAWRDIPSSGIYFAIYEILKRQFTLGNDKPTKFAQFMAGGIAGTVSWWSIIPLDVIKSRIQGETENEPNNKRYKGIFYCGRVIVKTHGFRGLFHGFWPLSIRAFPVNGTTFLVYEWLFRHCKQHQANLYS